MFPTFLQKLAVRAGQGVQRAGENLMPAPANGLLTPEQLSNARRQGLLHFGIDLLQNTSAPSTLAAVGHGLGAAQETYGGNVNDQATQEAAARQKNLLASRQAIMQKYAPVAGEPADAALSKAPAMYMDLLRGGDFEGAKQLEGIIREQIAKKAMSNKLQAVQAGDAIYTFDPEKGTYTRGPERHMSADELSEKALTRSLRLAEIQNSMDVHQDRMTNQQMRAFATQNKSLVDTEQLYENWKAALESARSAKPEDRKAAYKSAIVNFSRIADPGQRSSLGMLQYLEKVDPSLIGRFKLTASKLAEGDFPAEVLNGMENHVAKIHRNHVTLYNTRRAGRVKVNPFLEMIPTADEIFPSGMQLVPENSGSTPKRNLSKYMGPYSASPIKTK